MNVEKRIKELRKRYKLSQSDLAKKMDISRTAVSQIENGNRKICEEEIIKLAEIFNISTDILLSRAEEISYKIENQKEKKAEEKKQEYRISVPQKNINKLKQVLLYILNKVGSKPNIGETVIYKLLYFMDFNYYEKYEEQFMGATYIKNKYGPTPIELSKVIEQMDGKEIIRVKDKYFQYPQRKYLPLKEPDLGILNAKETKMIDDVLDKLSNMNAKQISEYSHKDVPWLTTKDGEIIDYEAVFYRTSEYSLRTYDGEDL